MTMPAKADILMSASISVEPTIFVKDGKAYGCGYKFIAMENGTPSYNPKYIAYAELQMVASGKNKLNAGVKGDVGQFTKKDVETLTMPKNLDIVKIWLKIPPKAPTPVLKKLVTSDKSILYGTDPQIAFDLLTSIQNGKNIQIGFELEKKKLGVVMYGPIEIEKEAIDQLELCLSEIIPVDSYKLN
jgi:hypothetical protein